MSTNVRRVLITGADRGIGAEFVRQFLADDWEVFAVCLDCSKTECKECGEGKKLKLIQADIGQASDVSKLANELKGTPIDILIHNAAVEPPSHLGSLDYKAWADAFAVNCIAPMRITEALMENIEKSHCKTVAFISSKLGSIADNTSGGSYIYRSTKAAMNMLGRTLAVDWKGKGIKVLLLHPGWVAIQKGGTEGGEKGIHNIVDSIRGMRKVLDETSLQDSGKFFSFKFKEVPW